MKLAVRTFIYALFALAAAGLAHQTQVVGEGDEQYKIIVGYSTEPAFTEERNGLDLFVRTADDEPVPNLEKSLSATLVAPDGTTRDLTLRAVHGSLGDYTDDFLLTATGVYQLRLTGFIGGTEVDLTFAFHDVRALEELRFP